MGLRGPPKGTPRTPGSGRKPGTPNKNTTLLKDAILMAGEAAGDALALPGKPSGLVGYLEWLAINHPPAFSGLVGKVLPMTVAGDPTAPVKTVQRVEWVVVDAAKTSAAIEDSNRPGVSPTLN